MSADPYVFKLKYTVFLMYLRTSFFSQKVMYLRDMLWERVVYLRGDHIESSGKSTKFSPAARYKIHKLCI